MKFFNLEAFKTDREIVFFDTKATARLSKSGQHLTIDFNDESREPIFMPAEEFIKHLGNKINLAVNVTEEQLRMSLTTEQKEKILRAERTVEALIEAGPGPGGKKHRDLVCKAVARRYKYAKPTPAKTAYNWYVAHHTCGLYTYFTSRQKQRKSSSQFDPVVIEIAHDVLTDSMFNPGFKTLCLSVAYDSFKNRITELDPKLRQPSYETFRMWFHEYDTYLVKKSKEGRASLNKALAQNVTGQYCFFRPLERVEADAMHVTLNIQDNDGNTIAKKIIIYFVIDCFSRSILGFHLQVGGGESEAGVIQSIRNAVMAKEEENWIQRGLPSQIVVDGGAPYRSLNTQSELLSLGIATRIAMTGAGFRKPFVERFIRTCRDRFFSTLPGYLGKAENQKRAGLLIDKSTPYTADQIRQRLTKWILNDYHVRKHSGLYNNTPLYTWKTGITDRPVTYIENHVAANIWLGQEVTSTISGNDCCNGVQIDSIRYNDRAGVLQKIGMKLKNKFKKKSVDAEVKCFWNQNDISFITVIDPFTQDAIRVNATTRYVQPGMSKEEYDTLIARLHPAPNEIDTPQLPDPLGDDSLQEELKSQNKRIRQQQKSRAFAANEDALAEATSKKLAGEHRVQAAPIVSTAPDDDEDELEVYDYE